MFRLLSFLFTMASLGGGLYWVNKTHPEYKNIAMDYINTGTFLTLEARYTAQQIMESNKKELLRTDKHRFLEPSLKFFPYLMMEVKYTKDNTHTGEGIILWDLKEGEMVLDTKNWQKTHGFADCINGAAERYEFKILNVLAEKGGILDRVSLIKALQIESNVLDIWIDSCRKKKLIVQTGNSYRLHFENPLLSITPETHIHDRLVTKSYKGSERVTKRFSSKQIQKTSICAFGNDFTIRNTQDVFLPVYSITVQNPDGSLHTSYWNALNGKILNKHSMIN